MGSVELSGLDDGNLLAWMAAVGALRTLGRPWPDVRMEWAYHGGWRPMLKRSESFSQDDILDALEKNLSSEGDDARWTLKLSPPPEDLNLPPDEWRALLHLAAKSSTAISRDVVDTWTVYASDCRPEEKAISKAASGFVTMYGQGHQHFLGSLAELAQTTTRAHLSHALFTPWNYADERPAMHWDPVDDRRYALRAGDPSKASIRTMRGANRLAVEALPWLPTFPGPRRAGGVGWLDLGRGVMAFRWPIWEVSLSTHAVRTVLARRDMSPEQRDGWGVATQFEAQRISVGKFTCFTSSRGI